MQKIKSASKANQPVNKACSKTSKVVKPVNTDKPANPQKDSKQSKPAAGHAKRIRKPLTDEQRKRKNEHDRLVRAAKRSQCSGKCSCGSGSCSGRSACTGSCRSGEKDWFTPVLDFIRDSVGKDIGPNRYAIFSKRFDVGDADVEVTVSRHRSAPRQRSSEDVFSAIADEVNDIFRNIGFPGELVPVRARTSEDPAAYSGPAWVGESWDDSDGFDGEDRS